MGIMKIVALFVALVASCSAFAPAAAKRAAAMRVAPATTMLEAQDTWWGDKDAPDSIVLGIGKDVPSGFYAVTSVAALSLGLYCVAQSNLLNILSGSTVNGFYVAGAF